jgi:transcriptional regulator with XRE-family HTH domain
VTLPGYVKVDAPTFAHKLQVRGLSVKQVADQTGLDEHTLYRMARGERVQIHSLQRLARYLHGIDPKPEMAELIGG